MAARKHWNERAENWHRKQKLAARAMRREPTDAEALVWERIRRGQVRGLHFRRQHPIGAYIVDFYCAALGLAIEIDGEVHYGKEQAEADAYRTEALHQAEVRVLRFTNADVVRRLDWVVAQIEAVCDSG